MYCLHASPCILRFCLFEMYVNVVFVIRCLYSAVSLTLVKEQHFIRFIYLLLLLLLSSFSPDILQAWAVTGLIGCLCNTAVSHHN